MAVDLIKATKAHISPIAENMREIDRVEVAAMGSSPHRSLRRGFQYSTEPMTIMVNGKPSGMFGVVPASLMEGRGFVWLLGTPCLYNHPRDWALLGPAVIDAMLKEFSVIENVVSTANIRAMAFLRHLGFEIETVPVLYGGIEFVAFRRAIQDKAHAA